MLHTEGLGHSNHLTPRLGKRVREGASDAHETGPILRLLEALDAS